MTKKKRARTTEVDWKRLKDQWHEWRWHGILPSGKDQADFFWDISNAFDRAVEMEQEHETLIADLKGLGNTLEEMVIFHEGVKK